jgi:CRISPR-associated endonuclease/helicase Cas3
MTDALCGHLFAVAETARTFAKPFGAGEIAYLIGLVHDLGKINPAFQSYLQSMEVGRSHPRVPHAIWGAAFIYYLLWCKYQKDIWKEFALPIYGHHSGLAAHSLASQSFSHFLKDNSLKIESMISYCVEQSFNLGSLSFPPSAINSSREMFIRMVFSTLVDADYLETERHFEENRNKLRYQWPVLKSLWYVFEKDQNRLLEKTTNNPSVVNRIRCEVYQACLKTAVEKAGLFRLTVPTGGGKTRSGLAFALRHAIHNDLCRIIVALPYTSIIDQTAREYRNIFENEFDCVLEHHSQIEVQDEMEEQDPKHLRYRLAAENWDAPLIVTTTVQFFESLFTNKPGRARKLHNIAKSIIILDEVQTIPLHLLKPTLDVLHDLIEHYGVSIVFSTATQPAFDNTPYLKPFHDITIKEIVIDYPLHFKALRRVKYEYRPTPITWSELAEEIRYLNQVMVVVNSRKDAIALIDALGVMGDIYHLSTLLCGSHRKDMLKTIRSRLKNGQSVRLISTQVVEAGVDLDFPTVYRAIGPLDRIVQAAGRCNREGNSKRVGKVIIFQPEAGNMPRGAYFFGKTEAELMLLKYGPDELHNPQIFIEYFQRLFSDMGGNLDQKGIQYLRKDLNYPEVAKNYHLIPKDTISVVVNYHNAMSVLTEWEQNPCRRNWRRLQPYLVNIYRWQIDNLRDWLHPLQKDILLLWTGKYDLVRGISNEAYDPADLIT